MAVHHQQRGLRRVLGLAFGVAIVVGGVIGQGILRTPGIVAAGAPDPALILALWMFGAVVTAIDAMSIVELGSAVPRAGGPYVFVERAFGRFGGFLAGWLDAGNLIVTLAYVAVVVAEYVARFEAAAALPVGPLAAGFVILFGMINALPTRTSGGLQNAASVIKVGALLLFAVICFSFRGGEAAEAGQAPNALAMTFVGLALAANAIQQTYFGASTAVYFSEEVDAPEKNLARATFMGVGVVALTYLLVNAALLNVLTVEEMASSNLPAADALDRAIGSGGALAATLFALFSVAAVGNVTLMQVSRTVFAMGRAGDLPRRLAIVLKTGAPIAALLLVVVLAALLASTGAYNRLIMIAAPILAFINFLVAVSALRLRIKEPDLPRPWRMPFYPMPALFSVLFNLGLMIFFIASDVENTRWSALFIVAAVPAFFLRRFWGAAMSRASSA